MTNEVELDVGGSIFKTTRTTLVQAQYFKSLFERWNTTDKPIFIDRSSTGFTHVLDFLRDINYKVPERYQYELDFYGITYNESNIKRIDNKMKKIEKLQDSSLKVLKRLKEMIGKIGKMYVRKYNDKYEYDSDNSDSLRDFQEKDFDYNFGINPF